MSDVVDIARRATSPGHTENRTAREEQVRMLLRLGDLEDAEENLLDALRRTREQMGEIRERLITKSDCNYLIALKGGA